ncbi:MAG TPA: glycosyltransferase [Vicinamibacterales bacterium]|nr:glycosyltransferase [Vicinamibacterales bacterium]
MRPPHVRPVHVAPPGVHPVDVVLPSLRAAARQSLGDVFGIPTTALCLVYAGRLSPEKNVSVLADMMARLLVVVPDTHLLLIGDGPEHARLKHLAAASAPGRVHFHPHVVDRTALCELTTAADIFVHPNPREPFGIGPLEAMALGVPVVLPAAGGVLTYATDANAWLAVPSAEGLAAAVVWAVSNPAERRRRTDAARHTAARYAWPLAAERMRQLHRAIHAARVAGLHPEAGVPPSSLN